MQSFGGTAKWLAEEMGASAHTIIAYAERVGAPFRRGGRNAGMWQRKIMEWANADAVDIHTADAQSEEHAANDAPPKADKPQMGAKLLHARLEMSGNRESLLAKSAGAASGLWTGDGGMVKRSVLIAALLVAILGALGIASATEDSGQTPETVVVPPEVVMPRDEPQETQETRMCVFTVTAYCPCEKCCGAYANGYTATGAKATQGVTIAADPDVLPMGTEIELDGHTYTVQDTGGAIAGNRLDLYFDSHEDALRWGVREKIVRWAG